MSIFDDIRKDRDFCGELTGFAACDCEEDDCFHDQVNAALRRRLARVPRLERIALAAEDEPRKSTSDLMHHIREMYPAAWAALGPSGQRSVCGFIDNKAAAFRAACGEGE